MPSCSRPAKSSMPIRRIRPEDCARAASGHEIAAPPHNAMKSRRLMPDMGFSPCDAAPARGRCSRFAAGSTGLGAGARSLGRI
jgi:hypothetical protein